MTNINGSPFLGCARFEELNSNFFRIDDATKETTIPIYKNKPIFLLFNTISDYSFQITVSSFNILK